MEVIDNVELHKRLVASMEKSEAMNAELHKRLLELMAKAEAMIERLETLEVNAGFSVGDRIKQKIISSKLNAFKTEI